MGLSQEWEKEILQQIFKRGATVSNESVGGLPVSPTNLYISLHSGDPTDDFSAALGNELSGLNYQRASLPPDTNTSTNTNWNAIDEPGTAQRITNKLAITFPAATGDWNAGTAIGFFGLWTIIAAGLALDYIGAGTISPSVTVLNGKTLSFAGGTPGNMQFTVS
jgi:hypothetical protein